MRKRTKLPTRWDFYRVGKLIDTRMEPEVRDWEDARNIRAAYRDAGIRIVKVHRQKLAPLVELPAWKRAPGYVGADGAQAEFVSSGSGVVATYWSEPGPKWEFLLSVEGWDDDEHGARVSTEGECRAACEKRLRELGFKVARRKSEADNG